MHASIAPNETAHRCVSRQPEVRDRPAKRKKAASPHARVEATANCAVINGFGLKMSIIGTHHAKPMRNAAIPPIQGLAA